MVLGTKHCGKCASRISGNWASSLAKELASRTSGLAGEPKWIALPRSTLICFTSSIFHERTTKPLARASLFS
ncbi:MAG TPA: hypothetical protein VLT57_02745, partial [Bryobacteraceae bacterium]|nr:hypothetical protein [Bryobacteraceae bacterium]